MKSPVDAISISFILIGFPIAYGLRFSGPEVFQEIGLSHFIIVSFLVVLPRSIKRFRFFLPHECAFLFWLLLALTYLAFYALNNYPMHSMQSQILGFAQAFALLLIFRHLEITSRSSKLISATSIGVSLIAVHWVPQKLDASNYLLASYQTLGMVIFLSGYLALLKGGKLFGAVIGMIALYALYKNGARTEFAVFLLIFLGHYVNTSKMLFLLVVPLAAALSAFYLPELLSQIGSEDSSRTLGLLNITADDSFLERQAINAAAWRTIVDNPISGDYASYREGFYSHNALSAWVDFGLLGFLVYISSAAFLLAAAIRFRRAGGTRDWTLILLVFGFLITIAFSKVYYHPLIGFIGGMISLQMLQKGRTTTQERPIRRRQTAFGGYEVELRH